jgi:uncharacterized protein (DUF1810 family)
MADPYHLQRFVDAQAPIFEAVRAELRQGRKQSHWMWFIFPQVRGLGHSPMAERYAIGSLAEARAYLSHPMLGARLRECAAIVIAVEGRSINQILGDIDALKFWSSMTLFARASESEEVFIRALEKHFGGEEDLATLERL